MNIATHLGHPVHIGGLGPQHYIAAQAQLQYALTLQHLALTLCSLSRPKFAHDPKDVPNRQTRQQLKVNVLIHDPKDV